MVWDAGFCVKPFFFFKGPLESDCDGRTMLAIPWVLLYPSVGMESSHNDIGSELFQLYILKYLRLIGIGVQMESVRLIHWVPFSDLRGSSLLEWEDFFIGSCWLLSSQSGTSSTKLCGSKCPFQYKDTYSCSYYHSVFPRPTNFRRKPESLGDYSPQPTH